MSYAVKEVYYTVQGEGAQAGRAAVFCRFSGCNLWTGREEDRATAICTFCDTDFVGTNGPGGSQFKSADALADAIAACWPSASRVARYVVFTGGEPLLQVEASLIEAVAARGFQIAVETNGTRPAPPGLDWITVSPKAGAALVLQAGNELKLVFPQTGIDPQEFASLEFDHFFLQPMDGPDKGQNTQLALRYCLANPNWRLSLQLHKLLGMP